MPGAALAVILALPGVALPGQTPAAATARLRPPVPFTADQDRQNMMEQLGIRALRPGPSGNENAPNHANDEELLANPYPTLPDPLRLNDGQNAGQRVTTARMWWQARRPEIVEAYEREVCGATARNCSRSRWSLQLRLRLPATDARSARGISKLPRMDAFRGMSRR